MYPHKQIHLAQVLVSLIGLLPAPLQGIGTLQLLAKSLVAPQDIMYISVGRWHASNCDGVGSKFASILDGIGRFAQENAATIPNIFFSPSPFDHVACGADK